MSIRACVAPIKTCPITSLVQIGKTKNGECGLAVKYENGYYFPTNKTGLCRTNKVQKCPSSQCIIHFSP